MQPSLLNDNSKLIIPRFIIWSIIKLRHKRTHGLDSCPVTDSAENKPKQTFMHKFHFKIKTNQRKRDIHATYSIFNTRFKPLKAGRKSYLWNITLRQKHWKLGKKATYVTKIDWQACPETRTNPNQPKSFLVFSIKKVQGSYKRF